MHLQGWQKHFSFGQAKYSGGIIHQCWTGKWTGMNYGMDYGIKKKFIAILNSTV